MRSAVSGQARDIGLRSCLLFALHHLEKAFSILFRKRSKRSDAELSMLYLACQSSVHPFLHNLRIARPQSFRSGSPM